jgi:hypothetical protein
MDDDEAVGRSSDLKLSTMELKGGLATCSQ